MPFTVRTADGELTFASADDVWQGVRTGTVSIEDRVCEQGSTQWRTVAELPGSLPKRSLADYHWYVLACLLAGLLLGFGPSWPTALMVLATLSAHTIWMAMHRNRR